MDAADTLLRFPILADAPAALRQRVAEAARPGHLGPHTFFYREGDPCPVFALVLSGSLRVFKVGEAGREITLYHVGGGEACLVNMLCAILDRPAPASAETESDVDALIVPAATFRDWIGDHEALRTFVFESMAGRLLEMMTLVEAVAFQRMDQRLADFLHRRLAGEPGGSGVLEATHEEIAAELGTAREVVSRLLKELERLGAVRTNRGRIELCDAGALAASSVRGA